jgi:hypothetical protein
MSIYPDHSLELMGNHETKIMNLCVFKWYKMQPSLGSHLTQEASDGGLDDMSSTRWPIFARCMGEIGGFHKPPAN